MPIWTPPVRRRNRSGGLPQRSSSSITAAETTGHHVLKISDYSLQTKKVPYGDHIRSDTFQAAGYDWHINYYPNGSGHLVSHDHEYVSLQLVLAGAVAPDQAVKARFTFCLLNRAGVPAPATVHRTPTHNLAGGWWFLNFIWKKDLERPELGLLRNDSFTVGCDIAILDRVNTAVTKGAPPPDLNHHFGELLLSGDGADITFETSGESFHAHRCVLAARSPVFKAKLLGPTKEGTSNANIPIEDMEALVFRALLQFMYTDSLPEMDEEDEVAILQHLLEAADRFDLQLLKVKCEDKLCRCIDESSVVTTLALAELHDFQRLQEKCFAFLKSTRLS
jgi:speckle-type POZ protein